MASQRVQCMLILAGLIGILIAKPISGQGKGASLKLRASWAATPYIAEAAELVVGRNVPHCLLRCLVCVSQPVLLQQ